MERLRPLVYIVTVMQLSISNNANLYDRDIIVLGGLKLAAYSLRSER
jgi:hypothetical protein